MCQMNEHYYTLMIKTVITLSEGHGQEGLEHERG